MSIEQDVEIFEVVDEDGGHIGYATRKECHSNPNLIHQTVHLLVFNETGNLWLQKRADDKDIQPGKWDTSVGGHMAPGESPVESIIRETMEEMGVDLKNIITHFCYKYIMKSQIETELVHTFCCKISKNIKINFNKNEISDGKFWTKSQIESKLGKNVFTPNFEDEWARFRKCPVTDLIVY